VSQGPDTVERQIALLGEARAMVVDCLGGNGRFAPVRFAPTAEIDFVAAFRRYVLDVGNLPTDDKAPVTALLLSAGRFLLGELHEADRIVEGFPQQAYKLDHGAGYCNVAHLTALRSALPLPEPLRRTNLWTAGSTEQAAIRSWLADNRPRLRWNEATGTYVLGG
jgi:hypothetical protein